MERPFGHGTHLDPFIGDGASDAGEFAGTSDQGPGALCPDAGGAAILPFREQLIAVGIGVDAVATVRGRPLGRASLSIGLNVFVMAILPIRCQRQKTRAPSHDGPCRLPIVRIAVGG